MCREMTPNAMLYLLAILLVVWMPSESYRSQSTRLRPISQHSRTPSSLHALQVKIYGTKNAYTTLRPYDAVLFKMDEERDGKDTAIALYLGGKEEEMRLLCCREDGGIKFQIDENYAPMNAQVLKNNGQIMRVVTAGRVRDDPSSVTIEEWLSSDIFIPIGNGKAEEALIKPSKPGLTVENFDSYLEMAENNAINASKQEELAALESSTARTGAGATLSSAGAAGGGVTLEALEVEVLRMEDQLNKVLGMIARMKRAKR